MASSFTQVYQYARPDNVDISILGKAATYKQQMYDTNVAQTQQLINQYAGSDLMRDVDREYLGERLGTLVNYINQAGAQDWSRRSVATDVASYVGQALDKNVIAGIASTQKYRKQMAEINQIKEKNPDLYSTQNEWYATRDLERYMTSGKVGDTYQAGAYMPYFDMQKAILDNQDLFKNHGAEVKWDKIGGNAYFTKLGEIERLTESEAANMIGMVLGDKGKQQMLINGAYQYKDLSYDDVKLNYNSFLNNKIQNYDDKADYYNTLMLGATAKDKAIYEANKNNYKSQADNIRGQLQNIDNISKDGMAYDMYRNEFINTWAEGMAYERVTDMQIDDSGFKIAQFEHNRSEDYWNRQFQIQKLEDEQIRFLANKQIEQQKLDLETQKALAKGEVIIDPVTNQPVANYGGLNSEGITSSDVPDKLEDKDQVYVSNIYNKKNDALKTAGEGIQEDFNALSSTAEGQKKLYNALGNDSTNYSKLAWRLAQGDQTAQNQLTNLYVQGLISEDTYQKINDSIKIMRQWKKGEKGVNQVLANINNVLLPEYIGSDKKEESLHGLNSFVVDNQGKIFEGQSYIGKNAVVTDASKLSGHSKTGAQIGMLLNLRTSAETEQEKSTINTAIAKLIATLPKTSQEQMRQITMEGGFFKGVGQHFAASFNGPRGLFNLGLGYLTGNEQDTKLGKELVQKAGQQFKKSQRLIQNSDYKLMIKDKLSDRFNIEEINRTSVNDNDGYKESGRSLVQKYFRDVVSIMDQKLQEDMVEYQPRQVNVDTAIERNKAILSYLKPLIPDQEIIKDASISIIPDTTTGTAQINVPVKDGKEIAIIPIPEVKLSELPPQIMAQINYDNKNYRYDPINNKNPESFYFSSELYDTDEQISNLYGLADLEPQKNHHTKERALNVIVQNVGKEFVTENQELIKTLLENPVQMVGRPSNGTYVLDAKVGGILLSSRVLNPQNIEQQKNDFINQKDNIGLQEIIKYVNKVKGNQE